MDTLRMQRLGLRQVVIVVCCMGALLAGLAWGIGWQSGSAASPRLILTAPEEALAGDPIDIGLTIEDANGISAFDVTIAFDTNAATLQSFRPTDNDLAALGLDVRGLGPVEVPGGFAVGAYACPSSDCSDPAGSERNEQDGKGTFKLASLTVAAYQSGPLTIDLSSASFTDGAGRPIEVDLSAAAITVQVAPIAEGE